MLKSEYNFEEMGVRSATLATEGSISLAELQNFLTAIPNSHLKYAFTWTENRDTMTRYLESTPLYFHILMRRQFLDNKNLRTAIWFEELDSKGRRHIHGVISAHKQIYYKKLQMPGLHLHLTPMSKYVKPLQTADEILLGRRNSFVTPSSKKKTKWQNPEHWEKYIIKQKKDKIFLILRVLRKSPKLKSRGIVGNALPKEI